MSTPDPTQLKGPGLLYVQSRIDRTDVLDETTFFKWYDEDHIDEIIQTSGINSAFRYRDVDFEEKNAIKEKALLAIYPLNELSFLLSDEFRGIRVKSDKLPETGIVYDLVEFDVRYLGLVEKTERKKRANATKCLIAYGVEPDSAASNEKTEDWFRKEHIPAASSLAGHICSSLFHLKYARTNAQSRALKGLPTTDAPSPETPTWLALHEFEDVIDFPSQIETTSNAQAELHSAKQIERVVYRSVKGLGSQEFFD